MEQRYMTVSEFAEKHGVPYQSAVRWARRGHIPGVKLTQFGKFKIYMIPENAKPPELPVGRPRTHFDIFGPDYQKVSVSPKWAALSRDQQDARLLAEIERRN